MSRSRGRAIVVRRSGDRGAILVIALIVVTVVAVVTGFVLTRGDGSLRATVALRNVAGTTYAADAAANVAINDLRTGYNIGDGEDATWAYTNETGTGCFGYDSVASGSAIKDTLRLDNLIPHQSGETKDPVSAAVVCKPEKATGSQGSLVAINDANKPGNAILTLGTNPSETGFTFKTNGSGGAFRVRGGIWSNSNIVRDNNGVLESTESIRAITGCSPASAMSAPVVNCSSGTAPGDPNYDNELTARGKTLSDLTLQIPPTTCPGSNTVTLDPGIYDDANKLDALTPNGGGNCFIRFKPGIYYFDFHNSSTDPLYDADVAGSGNNVWDVNSGTIVGGTLTSVTSVPGRCINPIDSAVPDQGVQFIFGGDSRMVIDKGAVMEICADYHTNRPPIAIYGQKTGTATSTTLNGPSALIPTQPPTVSSSGTFVSSATAGAVTAPELQSSGGGSAVWARTNAGATSSSSSITMTGFAPAAALPKGTVVTGAKLLITHRSTGSQNVVTLTPNSGGGLSAYSLPVRSTLGLETVDLTARIGWGTFQKSVHDNGFSGATLKFDSTLGKSQTAELDAARLELTYYVPQLRGQSGAVIAPGGAAVVQALGNTTYVYIQGTTYTPKAKIDLALNNIAESVFRFGVIARSLNVFETASFGYPGAVIELPDNSPGWGINGTLVNLTVYLCQGMTSGCTKDNGKLALRARVQVWDPSGTASPPNREISVLSWSHQR